MSYAEFRKIVSGKIKEMPEWKDLSTFVPNKKLPIYNWFYYKEGFAKELVEKLIEIFQIKEGSVVLDPFCGSGTTLLACKQNGINSIGCDVLPVSVFASRVKTADYDTKRLREWLKKIASRKFVRLDIRGRFPPLFYSAFSRYALEDIALLRESMLDIPLNVREFFTLALINAAIKCSYARKDGSVIKIKKRPVPPMRKMYRRIATKMIRDLEGCKTYGATARAELGDARRLDVPDSTIDAIITSPPYLNNIDYTKVYSIEEFFVLGDADPGIRAFVGLKPKESDFLPEIMLPVQARLYFEDIDASIREMYRVLKKDGHAAIVVGNGYVNEIIESDIIIAYLAESTGFSVENIIVLNKRFALEERTKKKGILRESLIILRK